MTIDAQGAADNGSQRRMQPVKNDIHVSLRNSLRFLHALSTLILSILIKFSLGLLQIFYDTKYDICRRQIVILVNLSLLRSLWALNFTSVKIYQLVKNFVRPQQTINTHEKYPSSRYTFLAAPHSIIIYKIIGYVTAQHLSKKPVAAIYKMNKRYKVRSL